MKVWIRYCRPFKNKDDEPPIEEIFHEVDGERPKKKFADGLTYVYDEVMGAVSGKRVDTLENERVWDGIE